MFNYLARQCMDDSKRWFPNNEHDLVHHALALGGEVGEVQNIIKKLQRGDLDLSNAVTKNDLSMEITDVLIYLLNLAAILRIDLYKTYKAKRAFNEKRWGNSA
jgi:NTP pyrophosphatase (non-canonical NTP hydrolase)